MVDSHAHLADEAFSADVEAVVQRARAASLTGILCVVDASDPGELIRAHGVLPLWEGLRTTSGVHPHRAAPFAARPAEAAELADARIQAEPLVRAVGEVGLDYHYDFAPRDVQRAVFGEQVRLACDRGLPLVIHTRDADDDTIEVLTREGKGKARGVFHCFSGDARLARRALDLGFYVSFSGIVTFPKAGPVRDAAAIVPLDRLLVETDAPYLAPVPHRGTRNEPGRVGGVVRALAGIRGIDVQAVASASVANYCTLFAP
ncbi:MAG: TatD family hydrolase [Vicinamibacterales bacterium]|jgi:TatD DNase family protein|nr:TatD family hydrolase [Vicinamibacterales bacterium]